MEIKGFQLLNEIHRGPVTTVYKARQLSLDRDILLKVLNVQWKNDRDLIERFKREAKICARLKHPNIVSIHDFGIDGEYFYISMEYVEGQTLQELIKQKHPLPFAMIHYITHAISSGLEYAHHFGIIHRDIKPSNVMIEKNGAIKITDFGLATINDMPAITKQGQAVGTPAYMSPEQAMGKPVDSRSDLFCLGSVLYEMSTGQAPFNDKHLAVIIQKTLNHKQENLLKLRPDIPEWFSKMTDDLLNKNPADRLPSAKYILGQLKTEALITLENFNKYSKNAPKEDTPMPINTRKSSALRFAIPVTFIFAIGFYFISYIGFSNPDQNLNLKIFEQQSYTATPILMENDSLPIGKNLVPRGDGQKKAENNLRITVREKSVAEKNTIIYEPSKNELEQNAISNSSLFITANPWAELWINNKYIETTPLSSSISLIPGTYILELRNPGYETFKKQLNLSSTQAETLNITLTPTIGYINIQVIPWAKVTIGDVFQETTPITKPIPLRAGWYLLKLENPNFNMITDSIEIIAGQTIYKRFSFK